MEKKYEQAKLLYVVAIDRLLLWEGKAQKYGMQYEKEKGGKYRLSPMDKKTTDAQRAEFNVPSLAELKKQAEKFNEGL